MASLNSATWDEWIILNKSVGLGQTVECNLIVLSLYASIEQNSGRLVLPVTNSRQFSGIKCFQPARICYLARYLLYGGYYVARGLFIAALIERVIEQWHPLRKG